MFIVLDDSKSTRFFLKVTKWERIREIKAKVSSHLHVPTSHLTLLYFHTVLLDDQRIDHCRIRQSATLTCSIGGRDKAGTRLPTMTDELDELVGDLSKISYLSDDGKERNEGMTGDDPLGCLLRGEEEEKRVNTSDLADVDQSEVPDYQRIYPGVLLLARCNSSGCSACSSTVYISKGFGVFRLRSLQFLCSKCHKPAIATGQYLFYKAKWRFTGVSSEGVRLTGEGNTEGCAHTVVDSSDFKDWKAVKLMVHGLLLA
jgi:hypothetical protein